MLCRLEASSGPRTIKRVPAIKQSEGTDYKLTKSNTLQTLKLDPDDENKKIN